MVTRSTRKTRYVRPIMLKGKAKTRYMRAYMRRYRAERPAKPPAPGPKEPKLASRPLPGQRCLACDSPATRECLLGRVRDGLYCLCETCVTEAADDIAAQRR